MLNIDMILNYFSLYSGLPDVQAVQWHSLCKSAAALLLARLRGGVLPDDEGACERLCAAAGALAYCDYLLLNTASASDEVRVGDITMKSAAGTASGSEIAKLREHFLAQVADLLEPEGVVFRQAGAK